MSRYLEFESAAGPDADGVYRSESTPGKPIQSQWHQMMGQLGCIPPRTSITLGPSPDKPPRTPMPTNRQVHQAEALLAGNFSFTSRPPHVGATISGIVNGKLVHMDHNRSPRFDKQGQLACP